MKWHGNYTLILKFVSAVAAYLWLLRQYTQRDARLPSDNIAA